MHMEPGVINLISDSKMLITMGHFGGFHVSRCDCGRPGLQQILQVCRATNSLQKRWHDSCESIDMHPRARAGVKLRPPLLNRLI